MPEGDTVWRAAHRLDEALSGRVLTASDFRVPQLATSDLAGRAVLSTVPRGKHLLTRVAPGPGGEEPLTVHTHLKMEGVWHVYAEGERWRRPGHLLRVRLTVGEQPSRVEALGFELGTVDLLPTAEEDSVVGHLGPDLLGPDWDAAEAVRRLTDGGERRARGVGEALLDQRCLAGIGNVYKSELCFVSGIHPETTVDEVGEERLGRMVALARRMLESNKARGERTTTGNTRRGQRLWVYGRGRQPCRRCGTPVLRDLHGPEPQERSTYWCPRCQPAAGR
ncbi:MAG: DNA-formamidopyrimidine glycosylase family protein [Nocardioides sp.]|nr:DNA-formamidopyrimidine glycosylase family protein [Nocardioides sp.]